MRILHTTLAIAFPLAIAFAQDDGAQAAKLDFTSTAACCASRKMAGPTFWLRRL